MNLKLFIVYRRRVELISEYVRNVSMSKLQKTYIIAVV